MLKPTLALCLLLASSPLLAVSSLLAQRHQPVLLISVDGLRPDYVTQADEYHLRIPNLRGMLANGTYANGVTGVFPTVTYPSHTTLVTGVWPAEHGILNNTRFDPERNLFNAWYWYADQIKTPTLWSAARAAGLHTASVSWPVTVDATSIDTLIPEYWRTPSPGDAFNPDDRLLLNAVSRPDGELMRIAQRTATPYMMGNDARTHLMCAVKGAGQQWVQVPPGNWIAPPGSNRSGGRGDEAVGAFGVEGRGGDLASL